MTKRGAKRQRHFPEKDENSAPTRSFEDGRSYKRRRGIKECNYKQKPESKMKFGKMMACAAIFGCTSAVNLETENTLKANSQDKWTLPKDMISYINLVDSENTIGFRAAYEECLEKNGRG